jgi:hypothetical protein
MLMRWGHLPHWRELAAHGVDEAQLARTRRRVLGVRAPCAKRHLSRTLRRSQRSHEPIGAILEEDAPRDRRVATQRRDQRGMCQRLRGERWAGGADADTEARLRREGTLQRGYLSLRRDWRAAAAASQPVQHELAAGFYFCACLLHVAHEPAHHCCAHRLHLQRASPPLAAGRHCRAPDLDAIRGSLDGLHALNNQEPSLRGRHTCEQSDEFK